MAGRMGPHEGHYQPQIAQAPEIAGTMYPGAATDADLVEEGRMSYHPFSDMSHSPFAPLASPLEKPAVNPPSTAANASSKDVIKSTPTPWYRTTKGLAIIIAGSLVVAGVIVAIAVGVTQSKNNRSDDSVRVPVGVTTAPPTATTTATTTTAITTTTAAAATTTTVIITSTATTATVPVIPNPCTPRLVCVASIN